ncbi:DUF4224 domain-containing protein [Pandoraea apista]|uniref:DUF4224 domain-containing protein n=1 Tax=Pandoraea apista TaxID=93218 RepID=UPI000F67F77E|nr:DUF4224 domain-containing protein [Pandoraea apista]RRW90630.1 DUF4224 domain-containing protein [Pandoraea apista]RRX00422.1 DUF4224 domain-containing protein [Pandoraea apista]
MNLTLSENELRELTQRQKYTAQVKVLRAMGIEHRIRPDGTVAVLRSHLENLMGGARKTRKETEWLPNWSAA